MGSSTTSKATSQVPHIPNHLVIVCCHAIYLGPPAPTTLTSSFSPGLSSASSRLASTNEGNWLIEPFQKGEIPTYIAHIEAGIHAIANDENAILVFSGGATKREKTDKTEGDGYLNVALEHDLFGTSDPTLLRRIFVDRFATDSYQNILLSLIQFPHFVHELLDSRGPALKQTPFPKRITIVSHEFKRDRFLRLHLPAFHWQGETEFIGINPPFDPVKMAEIEEGDRLRGYGAWEKDIYGIGEALVRKRKVRGWDEEEFARIVLSRLPEGKVHDQIAELVFLQDRRQDLTISFDGKVPWER